MIGKSSVFEQKSFMNLHGVDVNNWEWLLGFCVLQLEAKARAKRAAEAAKMREKQ